MDHESEVIKQQMEQTRSALAEKLETLEEHVTSTVRNTTEAVTGTVETVKGAVEDTVESVKGAVSNTMETVEESVEHVKEAFDLNKQMQTHPWLMMGGGVVVGYLGTCLLETGYNRVSQEMTRSVAPPPSSTNFRPEGGGDGRNRPTASTPSEPSTWDKVTEALAPAADQIKGLAFGVATAMLGRMILEAVPPSLKGEVEQVIDEVTKAVGGKPLPSFLHANPAESRASQPPPRP
jgi:ElaB/YqjD/DUF883 family membrane-anchored ribosome-binding protein